MVNEKPWGLARIGVPPENGCAFILLNSACSASSAVFIARLHFDFEMWRGRSGFSESLAPSLKGLAQHAEIDASKLFGVGFQIAGGTGEQGTGSNQVSAAVMMKRHRDLNQRLQKLSFRISRWSPNVLEHFVGLKEICAVE